MKYDNKNVVYEQSPLIESAIKCFSAKETAISKELLDLNCDFISRVRVYDELAQMNKDAISDEINRIRNLNLADEEKFKFLTFLIIFYFQNNPTALPVFANLKSIVMWNDNVKLNNLKTVYFMLFDEIRGYVSMFLHRKNVDKNYINLLASLYFNILESCIHYCHNEYNYNNNNLLSSMDLTLESFFKIVNEC